MRIGGATNLNGGIVSDLVRRMIKVMFDAILANLIRFVCFE